MRCTKQPRLDEKSGRESAMRLPILQQLRQRGRRPLGAQSVSGPYIMLLQPQGQHTEPHQSCCLRNETTGPGFSTTDPPSLVVAFRKRERINVFGVCAPVRRACVAWKADARQTDRSSRKHKREGRHSTHEQKKRFMASPWRTSDKRLL